MLYCSIEDAWGSMPIKEQMESYHNTEKNINNLDSLENFQNVIKKKINRKNKKPLKHKYKIRERFEDTEEESCDEEENYYPDTEEEEEEIKYHQEERRQRSEDIEEKDEEEEYNNDFESENDTEEDSEYQQEIIRRNKNNSINKLKSKVNKLIKENNSLKNKIKKLERNSPIIGSDFFSNFITDKNREIIIISLIGIMVILVFHMMIRSSSN